MKTCKECGVEILGYKSKVWIFCSKNCYTQNSRKPKPRPLERKCSKCQTIYPFDEVHFSKRAQSIWGIETVCRNCVNAAARVSNKRYKNNLRFNVLSAYGVDGIPTCTCCLETRLEFMSLDHIAGGGGKERREVMTSESLFRKLRREGYPKGYRTLCHNCNMSYGIYGYCPHTRE